MLYLLARWLILTIAIGITIWIFPGVHFAGGIMGLFFLALVFALVNATVRPIMMFLTCPFIILTLGFFILVINTFMLMFTAWLVPSFQVNGFGTAFFASIVISLISAVLGLFLHDESKF